MDVPVTGTDRSPSNLNLDICGTKITQAFRSLRSQLSAFPRQVNAVAP